MSAHGSVDLSVLIGTSILHTLDACQRPQIRAAFC
jgi:hypothetical protein